MTDNEIIKALECHKKIGIESCVKCPLVNTKGCACELSSYTLDLINRQKAEIEEHQKKIEFLQASKDLNQAEFDEVKAELELKNAENKRFREQIEEYPFKCKVGNNSEIHSKSIQDYDNLIADISAEGIKEFSRRIESTLSMHLE